MKSESDKILSMLEEGSITARKAEELLKAVEDDYAAAEEPYIPTARPDVSEIRAGWRLPFNISLVITTLSASVLWRTRHAGGLARLVRTVLFMPLTILAGLVTLVFYLAKDGPWLYVRVRSDVGSRFGISLPFPLHWIRKAVQFVQTQVPDPEAQDRLETAAEFLEAVETSNLQDPLAIDLRDEGQRVEIFLT